MTIPTGVRDTLGMKVLVLILTEEECLEEILKAYAKMEIFRATILDSEGMGRFLTYEVPLFVDFKDLTKGNKSYNKTILSLIHDNSVLDQLVPFFEKTVGLLISWGPA